MATLKDKAPDEPTEPVVPVLEAEPLPAGDGQVIVVSNVRAGAVQTTGDTTKIIDLPVGVPTVVDYTDEIRAMSDNGLVTIQHG